MIKSEQYISGLGFILLVPGFLLYNLLVAQDAIPPFAGGFYSLVSILILLTLGCVVPFIWNTTSKSAPYLILFVCLWFMYCILWAFSHHTLDDSDYIELAVMQTYKTVGLSFTLFLMGMYIPLEWPLLKFFIRLSCVILLVFLLNFVFSTGQLMFYAKTFYPGGSSVFVSSYQEFSRSALLIILYTMVVSKPAARICWSIFGIVILFILGSRSELYGFIIAIIMYMFVLPGKTRKWFYVCIFLILTFYFIKTLFSDILLDSRQFEIFDFMNSTSLIARNEMLSVGIDQINNNPIFGYFGGDFKEGGEGTYMHNILSAWVSYGLVGFLLYFGLVIVSIIISSYYLIIKKLYTPYWELAFLVNFISLILLILAKPVFWIMPTLGWGLLVNALNTKKEIIGSMRSSIRFN